MERGWICFKGGAMERWHDSWNGTVTWIRHKTWYGHDTWNGHEALECTKLYTQAWKLVHPFSFSGEGILGPCQRWRFPCET